MSIKERNLSRINKAILNLHERGSQAPSGVRRVWMLTRMWGSMLHYELVKNDVAIRAQSLSYFTLFSLLPLIAGVFLILGFFSQWGPVQKEFEELMLGLMGSIPGEERKALFSYMLQFKDQYLQNLTQKSGSIGAFAILVLFWIGARVFFNLESLMNRIWSVRSERPLLDRIRNFIFCMVLMPLLYALTISFPKMIELYGNRSVGLFLDQGILILLIFSSLFAVLKLLPNTKVSLKSALFGALAGTLGFGLSNSLLRIYFRFGTNTAYGKAGVLPVFAFFIYVAWMIFIFSVEVSLLVQQGNRMLDRKIPSSTLGQALILEKILHFLSAGFNAGTEPPTLEQISKGLNLGVGTFEPVLDFLERRGWVAKTAKLNSPSEFRYIITRDVKDQDRLNLLKDFLKVETLAQNFDVYRLISALNRE